MTKELIISMIREFWPKADEHVGSGAIMYFAAKAAEIEVSEPGMRECFGELSITNSFVPKLERLLDAISRQASAERSAETDRTIRAIASGDIEPAAGIPVEVYRAAVESVDRSDRKFVNLVHVRKKHQEHLRDRLMQQQIGGAP